MNPSLGEHLHGERRRKRGIKVVFFFWFSRRTTELTSGTDGLPRGPRPRGPDLPQPKQEGHGGRGGQGQQGAEHPGLQGEGRRLERAHVERQLRGGENDGEDVQRGGGRGGACTVGRF